jgi:hypothetical protein
MDGQSTWNLCCSNTSNKRISPFRNGTPKGGCHVSKAPNGGMTSKRHNMATKKQAQCATLMHECPDQCSGRRSNRQRPLTIGEVASLSGSAQQTIKNARETPYRCTYCGCVYFRKPTGNIRLGFLDGGVTGSGWHSNEYP